MFETTAELALSSQRITCFQCPLERFKLRFAYYLKCILHATHRHDSLHVTVLCNKVQVVHRERDPELFHCE